MSKHDEINESWEARINALLDGELDEQAAAALKQEAEHNQALARAIVDAHALQARIDELEIERAPATLRARLARISKTESASRRRWLGMPRWVPAGALAAVPLLVIAMVMMQATPEPADAIQREYSEAEVLQARQDLITALAYLDRVGERAGRQIASDLSRELRNGVNARVAEHMPFTHQSEQEDSS
jgi:hypothetical protein